MFEKCSIFSKKLQTALDEDQSTEVTVFSTGFSKAFDKVPRYLLIQMFTEIGLGDVHSIY